MFYDVPHTLEGVAPVVPGLFVEGQERETMQIRQVVMVDKRRVELQTATLDENPGADGIVIRTERSFIFDWMLDGRMTVEPLISHRLPPEKIGEAYEGLLAAPEAFTGVVIDWSK
jgi:hypothetical protein